MRPVATVVACSVICDLCVCLIVCACVRHTGALQKPLNRSRWWLAWAKEPCIRRDRDPSTEWALWGLYGGICRKK